MEAIIELSEARADQTTPADLLEAARTQLGDDVQLFLGYDFLIAFNCPTCESTDAQNIPLYGVVEKQALCPVCGTIREPQVISSFRGSEEHAHWTLAALGVPPLAILTARKNRRFLGLELTGDVSHVFDFE
ncbi:MAG: hypothetical protein IPK17_17550 [Chloroflexi bacterium]|uniref:hypothetical protein n=1 Tax=Candidatus Flexifilum breve TaxID=3140694 RepID=UPI0031347C55|nr:hypothetical protein [Chloroflexota bacterium]